MFLATLRDSSTPFSTIRGSRIAVNSDSQNFTNIIVAGYTLERDCKFIHDEHSR